jgi:hypothetical protein
VSLCRTAPAKERQYGKRHGHEDSSAIEKDEQRMREQQRIRNDPEWSENSQQGGNDTDTGEDETRPFALEKARVVAAGKKISPFSRGQEEKRLYGTRHGCRYGVIGHAHGQLVGAETSLYSTLRKIGFDRVWIAHAAPYLTRFFIFRRLNSNHFSV